MAGILVIGWIFADLKGFSRNTYLAAGRNLGEIRIFHGGVSRNIAENIAATGTAVSFLSTSEKGSLGEDILNRLNRSGVDTSLVRTVDANGIGKWMVLLNERRDVAGEISSPPEPAFLEALVEEIGEDAVRDSDCVILEADTSWNLTSRVTKLAALYQKPLYASIGNLSVVLSHPEWIANLDCLFCNQQEFHRILGTDDSGLSPKEMLGVLRNALPGLGCPSAVVTMGERGAVFCSSATGEEGHCPAVPVPVIDTTGAGDAFLSGTVAALSRGIPLSRAVRAGAGLAAMVLQTDESALSRGETTLALWENLP